MPLEQERTSLKNDTDPTQLRAEIARMQEELAGVRAEFSVLAGRLGHDLHGLLRNMLKFAQALQLHAGRRDPREQRWLGRIEATARQADALVGELVTLSRVRVAELDRRTIDLPSLVRDCVQELSAATLGRHIDWVLEIDPGASVQGDRTLLRLALAHMLANAVKFTRSRACARICVQLQVQPQAWCVAVSDNGAGFDPAYAHRLFSPFERLHGPAEFEGNGVGLATVKAVADKHGGSVHAIGAPDQGATFTLRWPRSAGVASTLGAPPAQAVAALESPARRLRLLVVDDEPLVLGTLRTMIEREGHEVVCAPAAVAGLQTLDDGSALFDAVLSDWLMPGMPGPEFARAVRRKLPRIPVFLLTGQRPAVDGSYAVPEGVRGVLAKPVRIADLRRLLGSVAARAQGGAGGDSISP
jgi:CheY-like chemotaxis protein